VLQGALLKTSLAISKGKPVNIPVLDSGQLARAGLLGFVCGNTRELEDGRKRRRQRSLFCLKK